MAHRLRGGNAADAADNSDADVSWKARRERALRVLRQVFGHDAFRGKQEVCGSRVVSIMGLSSMPVWYCVETVGVLWEGRGARLKHGSRELAQALLRPKMCGNQFLQVGATCCRGTYLLSRQPKRKTKRI